jgi:hypothetical protein
MLPRIKYLEASIILEKQKQVEFSLSSLQYEKDGQLITYSTRYVQAILSKIKLISQSHVVHKGPEVFRKPLVEPVNPADVPGLSFVLSFFLLLTPTFHLSNGIDGVGALSPLAIACRRIL